MNEAAKRLNLPQDYIHLGYYLSEELINKNKPWYIPSDSLDRDREKFKISFKVRL